MTTAAAAVPHPQDVPRHATGSKGDAWVVTLPSGAQEAAGAAAVLAFDTGRDSAAIVLGGLSERPRQHEGYDLSIVITKGSGELRHGTSPDAHESLPFAAPCVLIAPAGTWYAVRLDAGSAAPVGFFTRPGTVIDPFEQVGPRATKAVVRLDALPVWAPDPVVARTVPSAGAGPAVVEGPAGDPPDRNARVVPYTQPEDSYTLALDTGSDSLFVMTSRSRSWDRAPVDVQVHRHDDEDELILLDVGEGWLLNGPTPETVSRTPFQAPCVLVMPSGNFHRVVRTDDEVGSVVLVYAHRSAVVEPWADIMEQTRTEQRDP